MRAVFLSYRRDDTQTVTGFIYQHLTAPTGFGPDGVFMDIDDIPPGVDFREVIDETVGQCRFFLAVIGPRWVNARLQQPGDFVRLEIEAALKRGIPLVPVLVDGATLPKPEELPDSLRPLVYLNATSLRPGRQFATDIEQLVKGLHRAEEWKKRKAGAERPPRPIQPPLDDDQPWFEGQSESNQPESAGEDGWGDLARALGLSPPPPAKAATPDERRPGSAKEVGVSPPPTAPVAKGEFWEGLEQVAEPPAGKGATNPPARRRRTVSPRSTPPAGEVIPLAAATAKRVVLAPKHGRKAGDRFDLELPGGGKMAFSWCPPGTFVMGNPDSQTFRGADEHLHQVRLTRGFFCGVRPVTKGVWERVMEEDRAAGHPLFRTHVSWGDTQHFCGRLQHLTGKAVRLPTEAEWEYARRGGAAITSFDAVDTHPWGLTYFPLSEWCADWYDPDFYRRSPPDDPAHVHGEHTFRVVRGTPASLAGDVFFPERAATKRDREKPGQRSVALGFRVVFNAD